MAKAKVVFASMTGNTEGIAEYIGEAFEAKGVDVEVVNVDDTSADEAFSDADIAVVATYTYGEGELPDEIQDFHDEIKDEDLSGKVFGTVGSGDTSYDDLFCKAADDLAEALAAAGAKKGADTVKIEFDLEDEDKEAIDAFVASLVAAV